MAFYNGFPVTYTPAYAPAYAPVQQNSQQAAPQSGLIWVQGEAGAKSYLVAPNNTVPLWDSEAQVIYLKSADVSGMPSMKVLDYTIRDSAKNGPESVPAAQADISLIYATKAEIGAVSAQIKALQDRVDGLARKKQRREVEEDE